MAWFLCTMDPLDVPFDVEIVFAQVNAGKKRSTERQRGRNSPLYKSIWPIVCVMKVFGLAPYDYLKDRLTPTNAYMAFTAIFGSIYCYIMYTVFLRFTGAKRDRPVQGSTETLKLDNYIDRKTTTDGNSQLPTPLQQVIFNFFVALYNLLLATFTKDQFVKAWNIIEDYDGTVRYLGYQPQPSRQTKTTLNAWMLVIANVIVWTAVNQTGMIAFAEKWTYNVGYMIVYVGSSVAVYKFVGAVMILGRRFQHLNGIVRDNLSRTSAQNFLSGLRLKAVGNLHNELMIAGESFASQYSWSLLFWLANLTIHSVSNMYFVIDWLLFTPWEQVTWPLISCMLAWLTAFISQILLLSIACDFAARQANAFPWLMITWQTSLGSHCKYFHTETWVHFLNRRLSFSAAGCFDVNLPLLRSIAGLLSTYLVILLQLPE